MKSLKVLAVLVLAMGVIYAVSQFFSSSSDSTETVEVLKGNEEGRKKKEAVLDSLPLATNNSNPKVDFDRIDQHARECPKSETKSTSQLAVYLSGAGTQDIEKARALFTWMAENISYDDSGYNKGKYQSSDPKVTLRKRKAVCDGFSSLFMDLGTKMGLKVRKVSGYAKGYGYNPREKFTKPDHAWNHIMINGKWEIVDATWGGGTGENVNGKLVSKKRFEDYWFMVDPYIAIFDHLPENPEDQLISDPITMGTYREMPKLDKNLVKIGFEPRTIFNKQRADFEFETPGYFKIEEKVKILQAPYEKQLSVGKTYVFTIYAPSLSKMVLIQKDTDWISFEKEGPIFSLTYKASRPKGVLKLSFQNPDNERNYSTVLQYEIK